MQLEGTVLAPDPALASTTYTCTEAVTLGDVTHPRYLIDYLIGRGRGKLGSTVGLSLTGGDSERTGPPRDLESSAAGSRLDLDLIEAEGQPDGARRP